MDTRKAIALVDSCLSGIPKMKWISVKDSLPIQMPENWPTYDWVIVSKKVTGTDEPSPWNIARYTDNGWELFGSSDCPCFGELTGNLYPHEIEYWLQLPGLSS